MTVSRSPSLRVLLDNWVLFAVLVLCCVSEAVLMLGDAGLISTPRLRQSAYEYGGFWPGLLGTWQPNYPLQPYTMFLSYAFLHSGPMHLAFNMIALVSFGRIVTNRVGNSGFALLYLASAVGGGLGFGVLANTVQPMVGASGGLFGLVAGVMAWNYIDRYAAARQLWPVARAASLLILLNLAMWWLMDGIIAWETHLGGFICGWVAALLIDPRSQAENGHRP